MSAPLSVALGLVAMASLAAPALAQGNSQLPDPQPYARYVQWLRSLDDANDLATASIDWVAVDAAYRTYLDGVEKSRLNEDEAALGLRLNRDARLSTAPSNEDRQRANAAAAESWTRLTGLDDALLASTEEALPEALRPRFARVRNLVSITRCASGAAFTLEVGSEARLLAHFATMEVPSADRDAWQQGVDEMLASVAARTNAFRQAEVALLRAGAGASSRSPRPEQLELRERCLAASHDVEMAVEQGVLNLVSRVSEPTAIDALQLDFARFDRLAGGGNGADWGMLHQFVAIAEGPDESFEKIEAIVREVDATRIEFMKKRNQLAIACYEEDRQRRITNAPQTEHPAWDRYGEYANRSGSERARAEREFTQLFGVTDFNEYLKRPVRSDPSEAQRRLLSLVEVKRVPPLPPPSRGWRSTKRSKDETLPSPWLRQGLSQGEVDSMFTALGFVDERRQQAGAALEELTNAWSRDVAPSVREAIDLGDERISWSDREHHHTVAEREYAAWALARDAAARAEEAFFSGLLAIANTDRERAEILAWKCRRMIGDPGMAALRPSLPPGISVDAVARRGNLALAVVSADLLPEERTTATNIIAAHAEALLRASAAADRAEFELLGAMDRAVFARDHRPPGTRREANDEEAFRAVDATRVSAESGLAAPLAARAAAQDAVRTSLKSTLPIDVVERIERTSRILTYPGLDRDRPSHELAIEAALRTAPDDATRAAINAAGDRWRGAWLLLTDRIAEIGWPGRANVPGGDSASDGSWRDHHRTDFLLWHRTQETAMLLDLLKRSGARAIDAR